MYWLQNPHNNEDKAQNRDTHTRVQTCIRLNTFQTYNEVYFAYLIIKCYASFYEHGAMYYQFSIIDV